MKALERNTNDVQLFCLSCLKEIKVDLSAGKIECPHCKYKIPVFSRTENGIKTYFISPALKVA